MLMLPPEIVHKVHTFQPLSSEQVLENVLERLNLAFESLQHLSGSPRTRKRWRSLEHPAFDALFLFLWRKVRKREEILRFEVRTLEHELSLPLFIDQPGNRFRECP